MRVRATKPYSTSGVYIQPCAICLATLLSPLMGNRILETEVDSPLAHMNILHFLFVPLCVDGSSKA